MKLTIKVKRFDKNIELPEVINKGEWVDLRCRYTHTTNAPQSGTLKRRTVDGTEEKYRDVTFDYVQIPLNVAMKLPKGFEAVVLPRSSTFKNFGIIMANSAGVIDNSYSGNDDEWSFPAIIMKNGYIDYGSRLCQFRIQLSQKATVWQKIKWFFSSSIKLKEIDDLGDNSRGGIGSTGIN